MKKLFYIIIFICPFIILSCIDCTDGDGNIVTENRTGSLATFNEIELNGSFDLDLVQENDQKVFLEGDENILKLVSTKVSNGRLVVETKSKRCYSTSSSLNLRVSAKDISKVIISGSGNVYCDSLSTNDLKIRISGSGDVRFTKIYVTEVDADIKGSGNIILGGVSNNSYFRIDGSGDIKAYTLEQKSCDVVINGSGNVYASFTEKLTGVINGSGNVMYKTDAGSIDIDINGSGRVKKTN